MRLLIETRAVVSPLGFYCFYGPRDEIIKINDLTFVFDTIFAPEGDDFCLYVVQIWFR